MTSLASHNAPRPRVALLASIAFFGVMPLLVLALMVVEAIRIDGVAFDFRVFFLAAEAALRGDTIYPPVDDPTLLDGRAYVYPPFLALLVAPLTALPIEPAGLIIMAILVVAALAVPIVAGVRDWRCVGIVLLWPPVISAIQTGNVSILLALAAAVAWRFRDSQARAGLALGAAQAAKLLLWPLGVWLLATRRLIALIWLLGSAAVLVLASWALVGFDGFTGYPGLLQRLSRVMDDRGYSVYALALEFDVPSQAGRALWVAVALALIAGVVALARRGDERTAFVLAIAASLACTPVIWLHYFTLLVVVVAIAQPRLGVVWFVPLGMFLTPGSGNPTPFETSWTIGIAGLTVALSVSALTGSARRLKRVTSTSNSRVPDGGPRTEPRAA